MPEPIQTTEDIEIRTMKGDLEKITGIPQKKEAPEIKPAAPLPPAAPAPFAREAQMNIPQAPIPPVPIPPAPVMPTPPKMEIKPPVPPAGQPPVLVIPPKVIPPKEVPKAEIRPIFKTAPTWIKIGAVALGIILVVFLGLYGYWKLYIQTKPPVAPPPAAPATTTSPILPTAPAATTTIPIKFFNRLPNKTVTTDLPSKTPAALTDALKSEAKVKETIASIKQINITYQGRPITTEDFFNLMLIFAPQNFLKNYEDQFAFTFFSQKEGPRPILILKAKNTDLQKTQMQNWEAGTLVSDIWPLFLTDLKTPKNPPAFKSYLFISVPVRYVNVNIPYASLNYAEYNNFLVFSTSSAGLFIVLQDLTGRNVSFDYIKNLEASINKFIR